MYIAMVVLIVVGFGYLATITQMDVVKQMFGKVAGMFGGRKFYSSKSDADEHGYHTYVVDGKTYKAKSDEQLARHVSPAQQAQMHSLARPALNKGEGGGKLDKGIYLMRKNPDDGLYLYEYKNGIFTAQNNEDANIYVRNMNNKPGQESSGYAMYHV
jgi:hypothetical protein